ncbi:MAG: ABC transporter permease [Fidelibacterota bacterium]
MTYQFKIAVRNISRNKRRTALTASAIAITVLVLTFGQSYVFGVINSIFNNYIRFEGGHLKIMHREFFEKKRMLPLQYAVEDFGSLEDSLKMLTDVALITERIKFGVMLNAGPVNQNSVGIGIDPDREKDISGIQNFVKGDFIASGKNEMIIGSLLADKLNVGIGDTLTVITRTIYQSIGALNLKITGIFSLGFKYLDEKTFYIPLDRAQYLLDMENSVSEIIVILKNQENLSDKSDKINRFLLRNEKFKNYISITWIKQEGLEQALKTSKISTGLFVLIIFLLSGLAIMNTMLMSVLERTREIGVLMALGMKRTKILFMILWEAVTISIAGGIIGGIAGSLISIILGITGINLGSATQTVNMPIGEIIYPRFKFSYLAISFLFGVVISIIASLYPATRASRLEPVEALRSV